MSETSTRPAIMAGTSSDRIGTPEGRAVYLTASKDLEAWTGLPLGPYVGLTWGDFDDEVRIIGGALWRLDPKWSVGALHDGVNTHLIASAGLEPGFELSFILVDAEDPGFSVSWAF